MHPTFQQLIAESTA